jgi:hypothetical protein
MPFVGRLVLAMAMWSARNVCAAVGMPCEDMLRLLDNDFAFFVLVSSCVGLGIWLGSLSMVKEVGIMEKVPFGSLVLAMGIM